MMLEFSARIKEVLDYDMPIKINEVEKPKDDAPDYEEEDVEDED